MAQEPLLRPVEAADRDFLLGLYRLGRADEGRRAGLPDALWQGLLAQQFAIREQQYAASHPRADDSLVLDAASQATQPPQPTRRIGRLCVDRSADGLLQLIDIALLPECQGRGLGRTLLIGLQQEARLSGRSIELHVAAGSPAERLYESLGFFVDSADALEPGHPYRRLRWRATCIASIASPV